MLSAPNSKRVPLNKEAKLCSPRLFIRDAAFLSVAMLSAPLPQPSSFRVSIELAREKAECSKFRAELSEGALPRSGLRLLERGWSLWSPESVTERELAARACLNRPLTARSKADVVD